MSDARDIVKAFDIAGMIGVVQNSQVGSQPRAKALHKVWSVGHG